MAMTAGCAGTRVSALLPAPNERAVARALNPQTLNIEGPVAVTEPARLMALTPEMARFADSRVRGLHGDANKVKALHRALLGSSAAGNRQIRYHARATLTPEQAFARRRANCLSFSLLFVSMARHVGLNASVNDVTVPPAWNIADDRVQFMRHVNAKVDIRFSTDDLVVDLDMDNYRTYYPQTLIPDAVAKAQYYNNLAMALSPSEDTLAERFYLLRQALILAPEESYLWNNLAALYARAQHLEIAQALYIKALDQNPRDLTALFNLSEHYRRTGQMQEHRQLAQFAHRYRERNPYYHYRLADQLYRQEDYRQAAQSIETAIRGEPHEKRFYRLAAAIYAARGQVSKQRKALSQL